jgi:uncharacterized Zn-binding protein involved in type VI secretion
MSKPATRLGDKDVVHDCNQQYRAQASENVMVNGKGWSRQGDVNTFHQYTPLCDKSHAQPIATGSTTVFINGKGAGRIGDAVAGCTSVAEGSDNVFAG